MAIPEMQSANYNPADSDEAEAVVLEVPPDLAGMRLDQVLGRLLPEYSRSRLQAWVREGLVDVDGAAADPARKMRGLERLSVLVQPDAEALAFVPEPIPLAIVHEDEAIVVLDKPAGLVVHPAHGNWSGTLLNGLLHHSPAFAGVPRGGIVHRLDKGTSGLMVVAKTLVAQTELVRQLQARTVTREYLALVDGQLKDGGSVDASIARHPHDRTRMAVAPGGKAAVTHYRVLEAYPHHTLVQCRLETGRTHQIRVHMQHIGYPLTGDPVYGGRRRALPAPPGVAVERFGRQALHAARLALMHPLTLERRTWEAPMPEDMKLLLDSLR